MIVRASDRFTRLRWGYGQGHLYGRSEPSQYSTRWTVYVCPNCESETGFERLDFLKHVGSSFSNLIYQDRQAVEREVARRVRDENAFIDFYCPGCNGVVRTYYKYERPEEKIHGEGVELTLVVENKSLALKPC